MHPQGRASQGLETVQSTHEQIEIMVTADMCLHSDKTSTQ